MHAPAQSSLNSDYYDFHISSKELKLNWQPMVLYDPSTE